MYTMFQRLHFLEVMEMHNFLSFVLWRWGHMQAASHVLDLNICTFNVKKWYDQLLFLRMKNKIANKGLKKKKNNYNGFFFLKRNLNHCFLLFTSYKNTMWAVGHTNQSLALFPQFSPAQQPFNWRGSISVTVIPRI